MSKSSINKSLNVKVVKSTQDELQKSETSEQVDATKQFSASSWIQNDSNLQLGFQRLKSESSILPQCICCYRSNIVGFGIGIKYKDEYSDGTETADMKAEWDKLDKTLKRLNLDKPVKEVFEDFIENYETFGISYLEVMRNLSGEITSVENIDNVSSVQKTVPLDIVNVTTNIDGETVQCKKKFRKYKQVVGGKTVFFKEFGDPRLMDKSTGEYRKSLPLNKRANELLEYKIGTLPYGEPRWVGQVLGIDGSRRAETLNNNYFKNGRHTPLLIAIEGGTLNDESYAKLQQYMNDIKGENGQHAFIILEVEKQQGKTAQVSFGDDKENVPHVEIKNLANILQKDELFQEYIDNNRKRVQSSFNLPDIYLGYTTDFNRATAQVALEITETQVFKPKRESLAWRINHKLLNFMNLKFCEIYFKEPDLTNPDDVVSLLNVANQAGGVTPNMAKDVYYKYIGKTSEDFPDDYGNIPLAIYLNNTSDELQKSIIKAQENDDTEIVVVLKQVRDLLLKAGELRNG